MIIQLAAISAVVAKYRDKYTPRHFELWVKIALAAIGFAFYKQIKAMFSVEVVAFMFIIGGVVFLVVERIYKET